MEVAGGMAGCWLHITDCVHADPRAKQAVPGSPRSALQHEPAPRSSHAIASVLCSGLSDTDLTPKTQKRKKIFRK